MGIDVDVELYLLLAEQWQPTLRIPSSEFSQYTIKPLKWLRFLGYAIYGQEGHLSLTPDGDSVDVEPPVLELKTTYYFRAEGAVEISC
jgi:hypothetical protein